MLVAFRAVDLADAFTLSHANAAMSKLEISQSAEGVLPCTSMCALEMKDVGLARAVFLRFDDEFFALSDGHHGCLCETYTDM